MAHTVMPLSSTRRSPWGIAALCLASLCSVPTSLLAQDTAGVILGTVIDKSGAGIPGAEVKVSGGVYVNARAVTTDGNGNYQMLNVPAGVYTVSVSKTGFATRRQQSLEVRIGAQVTYSPQLEVGQVTEVVEVTEVANQIDTTSAKVSTSITRSQIESLPQTSRTFNSLLQLAPGVRGEVKGGNAGVGGFSVDGASGSENTFFIDGSEVTDVRRGSLGQSAAAPSMFLQEVQVRSGGVDADTGGAMGGVVNVVTKSGTNQFHVQAFYEFTNAGLNAGDRGYYQRSPLNADASDFFRPKEDKYSIQYPGGSVSGRIIKDKLFFFSGISPEFERTTRDINYASGNRTFKQSFDRWYAQNRLDYNVSQKLQMFGSWMWSPTKRIGTLPNRDARVAAPTNNLGIQGGYTPSQTASFGATWTATNKLVITGRYGYRTLNGKDGNYGIPGGVPFITYNTSALGLTNVPDSVKFGNGYQNVSSTLLTLYDTTGRKNLYLDANYLASKHNVKFGYALNRLSNDVQSDYPEGRFIINWDNSFTRGSVNNVRGTYGYYSWEDGVRLNSGVNSRNQGFYVQDTWRAKRNLTLNLGVRFENEFLPPFRKEQAGINVKNPVEFGWGEKIAPRLGFAWDPSGQGLWKIAGSFGVIYDVMKYELARGSFGGDVWVSSVYRLDNPNVFTLNKANPGALGSLITRYDNRSIAINNQGEIEGIDPDIKPSASRDWNFQVERQLGGHWMANVRYVHKDLLRTIEDIGVLDAEDSEVYLIGNPGFGETTNTSSVYGQRTPNGKSFLVPKAVRQYDAVEFSLRARFAKWNLFPSYTWSRLYGNYSGLANSDEAGRSDPGVSRAYDLPYYYFDASGSQENRLGRLGTDRPHTFRMFGTYELKNKLGTTTFGGTQFAFSGTPDSTSVIYLSAPTFPNGRGDMGRTPVYTQTDVMLRHQFNAGERAKIQLEMQVRNLFNQAAVIARVTQINRNGAITIDPAQFFKGYNVFDYVKVGTGGTRYNPIYGLPGAGVAAGGGPGTARSSAFSATLPNFGAYQDFRTLRIALRFVF